MNRTRIISPLARLLWGRNSLGALLPLVLACLLLWPVAGVAGENSPDAASPPSASTSATPLSPPTPEAPAFTGKPAAPTPPPPSASPAVTPPAAPPDTASATTATDPIPDLAPIDPEPPHAFVQPVPPGFNPWDEPEPGFEIARFPAVSAQGRNMDVMVVRVDPTLFDIVIRTATTPGEQPRTLQDWAAKHNLLAAINAGMYLPDGLTNTGYLRVGEHLNNPRINGTFGAFLVAEPLDAAPAALPPTSTGAQTGAQGTAPTATQSGAQPELVPSARLLERGEPGWEEELARYRSVVQNYRMVSGNRRLLWRPSPQEHAIAAIGRDSHGRILLIHSREPVTGVDFANMVLELPIDLGTLMYLEGGTQAGLFVRPGGSQLRMGRHPADFWTDGSVKQLLPNIIGVKPKGRQ